MNNIYQGQNEAVNSGRSILNDPGEITIFIENHRYKALRRVGIKNANALWLKKK